MHITYLFKSVKDWVLTDGALKGGELGFLVGIYEHFGANGFTLDMAQLFKSIPNVVKSPGIPSVQAGTIHNKCEIA